MTVKLTAFTKNLMADVIREHAVATDHSPFCCDRAKNYAAQIADCELKPDVKASEAAWKRGNSANGRVTGAIKGKAASEAQVKFVESLLSNRQYDDLEGRAWKIMLKNGMSAREAGSIIDRLKERPFVQHKAAFTATTATFRPASEKQVRYIESLAQQRDWQGLGHAAEVITSVLAGTEIAMSDAGPTIDALLQAPTVAKPKVQVGEEGLYFLDGEYYKVQRAVHGSGRLYSKKFNREDECWNRGGQLGKLTAEHKLTAEQASEWGALYGKCISCFLPLTDERSIAHGYGAKCAENNGWPY